MWGRRRRAGPGTAPCGTDPAAAGPDRCRARPARPGCARRSPRLPVLRCPPTVADRAGQDVLGNVDAQAQQRRAQRLAQVVATQRAGTAAAQSAPEYELHGEHIGCFVALDRPGHERTEVVPYAVRGDLPAHEGIGLLVVGEQRQVADVTLVTGPNTTDLAQRNGRHTAEATLSEMPLYLV